MNWFNATYLACLLCTNTYSVCWDVISPKPYCITNQVYFRSAGSIDSSFRMVNGKLCAAYGSTSVEISNACIAGKGMASTVQELKNLCGGNPGNYNVFFYHD